MADVLDTLVIMGVLLVLIWIGFLIMALKWVIQNAATVGAVALILVAVAFAVHDFKRR